MNLFVLLFLISTVVKSTSFEEMVKEADLIIEGKVKERKCVMEEGHIYTYLWIDVLKNFKGEFPDGITLRVRGGKVGNLVEKVSGAPTFEPEERVILFLKKKKDAFNVLRMSLGKFKIEETASGRAVIFKPEGLSIYMDGRLLHPEPQEWKYEDFISLLEEFLEKK